MGCQFFFDEEVSQDHESSARCTPHQVEVVNNASVPEIAIGPIGAAHEGLRATFNDWAQFERFVASVIELRNCLAPAQR